MDRRMAGATLLSLALTIVGNIKSHAALLAYEPFANPSGTALIGSDGGFGFKGPWQDYPSSQGTATNAAAGLGYTDASGLALITAGGAGVFQGPTNDPTSLQPIRPFGFSRGEDGTRTWISFLAVRQGPSSAGNNPYPAGASIPHDLNAGDVQTLAIGNSSAAAANTVALIPGDGSTQLTSSSVPFSQTNFIVARIDHQLGANDHAYLFLNPPLDVEPDPAQADVVSAGDFDFSFDRLRVFVDGNDVSNNRPYAELVVDEYRLGETYADVAPYVRAGPLVITNAGMIPGTLVLSGAGGAPNAWYHLQASPTTTRPSAGWTAVATNQFDAQGHFVLTNLLTDAVHQQFYRLRQMPLPVLLPDAHFVSPTGSDGNPGTEARPFLSITKGLNAISASGTLYLRGGTYAQPSKLSLSRDAVTNGAIRVWAYPGETPIINSGGNPSDGISISGTGYHLKGLTVMNAGHNGINISGHSNTIEQCTVHDNANTGLHITGGSSGTTFPSHNLVLNCDSYLNYDPPIGGNADGFSAKWNLGPGNSFRGCRAWWNSDDAWDLWMGNAPVLIEDCWAFWTGTNYWNSPDFDGNGNGFKLGGNGVGAPHRLLRCLAFQNTVHGVDQNNNVDGLTIDHNTAWNNGGRNFNLNHGPGSAPHVVRNNLSIGGGNTDSFSTASLLRSNSWQVISNPTANATDLVSVDTSGVTGPRNEDGGLPIQPFLHPLPGGRLVDQGVDIGLPFAGAAPDLGAWEVEP